MITEKQDAMSYIKEGQEGIAEYIEYKDKGEGNEEVEGTIFGRFNFIIDAVRTKDFIIKATNSNRSNKGRIFCELPKNSKDGLTGFEMVNYSEDGIEGIKDAPMLVKHYYWSNNSFTVNKYIFTDKRLNENEIIDK